jgi:hypothetical protein
MRSSDLLNNQYQNRQNNRPPIVKNNVTISQALKSQVLSNLLFDGDHPDSEDENHHEDSNLFSEQNRQ